MVKPSDILKLTGQNYWTWKEEAEALLLAEGLWNATDPSVPVPGGIVQMRTWTKDNQKAYGILYLTLNPLVQSRVNKVGVGKSGRLLWAQLSSIYTTSDPATCSMLMAQLNNLSHDIMKPADDFLQAVVTAESRHRVDLEHCWDSDQEEGQEEKEEEECNGRGHSGRDA
ncbi:hypothetical protein B0H10DRAFT_2220513 [Mycena sp. CBHHK59/15]|nr:hypothetical protein B0H10DRAFT_2220513 [Mycena sp. CBHHK59/15]